MGCPSIAKSECEFPSDWSDYVTRPELIAKKGLYLSGDPLSSGLGCALGLVCSTLASNQFD